MAFSQAGSRAARGLLFRINGSYVMWTLPLCLYDRQTRKASFCGMPTEVAWIGASARFSNSPATLENGLDAVRAAKWDSGRAHSLRLSDRLPVG